MKPETKAELEKVVNASVPPTTAFQGRLNRLLARAILELAADAEAQRLEIESLKQEAMMSTSRKIGGCD